MTDTFTGRYTSQTTGQITFRLLTAQFGDGYKQEVVDGINAKVQSWPLTFAGTESEMQAIVDFFDAHAGIAFYWTPPLGTQGLYKAGAYTTSPQGGGVFTVAATFEQSFAP